MKIASTLLLILSFFLISCDQEGPDPQSQGAYQKVADANKNFAFDLLESLQEVQDDKNIFFSPVSISMALSMTNNGAAGDTYLEISKALATDEMTAEEVNKAYQSMHYDLEKLDPKVKLKIANSTWAREGFEVKRDFINTLRAYYDSEAYVRDFNEMKTVDEINDWAADNTEDKIKKVIDVIDPNTVMFLMNAIYFKGDWQVEFDKKLTEEADFFVSANQQSRVQMMKTEADFEYYEGDQVQIVDLPYGNGAFSMSVILPEESYSLDELIDDLDADRWEAWMKGLSKQALVVFMPSLELRYEKVLNDQLRELGMEKPFIPSQADFSHLSDQDVHISFVKHDSYLKIDEKGTEAAAVTTVGIRTTSVGPDPQPPVMRVDRPYLLVIRERSTDNLLFVGKILDPEL